MTLCRLAKDTYEHQPNCANSLFSINIYGSVHNTYLHSAFFKKVVLIIISEASWSFKLHQYSVSRLFDICQLTAGNWNYIIVLICILFLWLSLGEYLVIYLNDFTAVFSEISPYSLPIFWQVTTLIFYKFSLMFYVLRKGNIFMVRPRYFPKDLTALIHCPNVADWRVRLSPAIAPALLSLGQILILRIPDSLSVGQFLYSSTAEFTFQMANFIKMLLISVGLVIFLFFSQNISNFFIFNISL